MSLIITANDITYKNIVGICPSCYIVINPDFDNVRQLAENEFEIKCTIETYKDKSSKTFNKVNNLMPIQHIYKFYWLKYTEKATLENDINQDLKSYLEKENPNWVGKISVVIEGYQQ